MAARTAESAAEFLPDRLSVKALREAAEACRGCELYANATQTVFSSGPVRARAVLVGEQPGDREDREGEPFVGPAGAVLDRALADAGIERRDVYLTNAVKHFKWKPRGKRRIHQRPSAMEMAACRPWLEAELQVVRPELLVAMGAVAAQSLYGRDVGVLRDRGTHVDSDWAPLATVTVHPSSILRGPPEEREEARAELARDLETAWGWLRDGS